MTDLHALATTLAGLEASDRSTALEASLSADLAAERGGFPVVVVADDAARAAALLEAIPGALALPPFREVTEWSPEQRALVERAGVLVALTTAGQLLPRALSFLITQAAASDVPIALLVDALDRVRDPETAAARAPQQLGALLGRSTVRRAVVCLGGARFVGPELTAAAATGVALREPSSRGRALAALRAVETRAWLERRLEDVRKQLALSADQASLARDTEQGADVLARRFASAWAQPLSTFAAALSRLEPDALVRGVYEDAATASLPEAFVLRLRGDLDATLAERKGEVARQIERDLEELGALVAADLRRIDDLCRARFPDARAPAQPGLFGEDFIARALARLDGLSEGVLAAVVEPPTLRPMTALIARLPKLGEVLSDGLARVTGEDRSDAPVEAAPSLMKGPLQQLPESLLRVNLLSATAAILDDARGRAEAFARALVAAWSEQLAAEVLTAFRLRGDDVAALRSALGRRLTRLDAAQGSLR